MYKTNSLKVLTLLTTALLWTGCGSQQSENNELPADEFNVTSLDPIEIDDEFKEKVRGWQTGCSVAADCQIVTNDVICGRSFDAILLDFESDYRQAFQLYQEAITEYNSGPGVKIDCHKALFPEEQAKFYTAVCIQNRCEARYQPPQPSPEPPL
ncbi:MAG: hypothetical protein EA369_09725 [Bradymonadales bacterium]|nr:MAG: hypothetical protein EA369_09725 [Bradymonadales bacterium]